MRCTISTPIKIHKNRTRPATPGTQRVMVFPLFCVAKRKKGNKEKERISKQKLLKSCHQYQNVTVLDILERLKFKNTFQYFIASTLWNQIRWPCTIHSVLKLYWIHYIVIYFLSNFFYLIQRIHDLTDFI